ncbi:unnamed protein product [Candidula unifasciata]|uniref:Uncharacterized protein n=1 Tax=Candidula unifasciata TaxID=100452 RepID=A0A8S3ZC04_9EUPU|nr:unnamed protein product [Candidula unifasciata]
MDDGSLYYAVIENDFARLTELLQQGGNVDEFYEDTMNISSKSLLHVCCGKGHVECLKVLIEHGAQLDVRDKWGQTPLMYSVTIQFPEVAKVLLDADADLVSCQDRYGKAPLHCAVEAGSDELVQLLLQYGADINIRCHDGMTPLMMCCTADTDGKKVGVMKVLLEAGALIDLKDFRGKRTALHVAASSGNTQAVEMLIAAGADTNEIDKTLRTPLTLAENFMKIISLLVSAGADLNVNVTESCNPLLSATLLKSEPMISYFLSIGADPNIKFSSGVTPALVTSSTGDHQSLRSLIFYNANLTIKGSVYKRRKRIEYILDPFELAYMEGHLDLCVLMAKAGYNVSLTLANQENIPEEYKSILKWLIDKACNPRSLFEEAIFQIRECLGCRLVSGVESLPLPSAVRRSVLLTHILT